MDDQTIKNKLAVEKSLRKYAKGSASIYQALLNESLPFKYRERLFSVLKAWTICLRGAISPFYSEDLIPKIVEDEYQIWLKNQTVA